MLLKDQRPTTTPVKREDLVAAAHRASKFVDKIKDYADTFFREAAKKGAENIMNPTWWLGVGALIGLVVEAVRSWLQLWPF